MPLPYRTPKHAPDKEAAIEYATVGQRQEAAFLFCDKPATGTRLRTALLGHASETESVGVYHRHTIAIVLSRSSLTVSLDLSAVTL
jgi:hypothetical protein